MTYREAYETWLKEFADDQATVDELKAIAGDEKEIEDRFYTELSFGTPLGREYLLPLPFD